MKWNKALVTGGAGFIGSHMVDGLVNTGVDLRVIDDLSAGLKRNLEDNNNLDKIEFVEGDIAEYEVIRDAISDVDIVYHLAANASIPIAVENPLLDFMSNTRGTFNLLQSCLNSDVKKIVYASSAALFGVPKYFPIDEDHPTIPISPYGASKLAGEMYGFAFQETYGLKFTTLRIFNAIGPRQPRYVIYDFLNKLKRNSSELEILGTGDVVKAFIDCAEKSITDGKAYNLGTGVGTTITELANKIFEELNIKDVKITYTGFSWKGDIMKLVANPARLMNDLKIKKFTSLSEALSDEINWFIQKFGKI